ncbi:MAG: Terminase-like family protein [Syntrophorhabdales bacterium]|jgi:hypothetical protein
MPEQRRFIFDKDLAHFTPRQMQAVRVIDSRLKKFILYGGAMGGGKSYFLRWIAVRILMQFYKRYGLKNVMIMLACEDYTSLKDRQLSKIATEFPAWLGTNHTDHKAYGRCFILSPEYGGGIICFRNLDDPSKYASSEFAAILVDELTKNLIDVFNHLRTRLRWPGIPDIECLFIGGTNPGGIGHGWVKQLWMDGIFPEEFIEPVDMRPLFAYIPSKADDNPYLTSAYWNQLATLPLGLRKAFRDGDWNIFVGQAFPEFGARHIIKPFSIPEGAPLYMVMDWGFGKPFSVNWIWTDADGRGYVFAEWYGTTGNEEGLRLPDSALAEGIKDREAKMKLKGSITRIAGPDCWAKKPNYQGEGQGPSTQEVFAQHGLYLVKGDPTRAQKIRQFRERLQVPEDGTMPMLVFYETCTEALRTIPVLVMDKNKPEDLDTKGEDHIYDALCHFAMARPMALPAESRLKTEAELRIDLLEQGGSMYDTNEELYLAREMDRAGAGYRHNSIFDEQEEWERDLYTRRARQPGVGAAEIIPGSGVE